MTDKGEGSHGPGVTTGTGRLDVRAVMFVDISGSSRLYKELGDKAALDRVRVCLSRLGEVVEAHDGRVIKHIGDGLMVVFTTADEALHAAESMQVKVANEEAANQPGLSIHVGCHVGPVFESRGDVFGDTVNLAARIAGVAHANQIITTKQIADAVHPLLKRSLRPLDHVSVKGHRDPLAVFEYLWGVVGDATMVVARPANLRTSRLKLTCGPKTVWLDRTSTTGSLLVGRNAQCHVAVNDPTASRQHATIEVRGGKFVLVDHSVNGTYVAFEATETVVKREEMVLPARGRLGLGASISAAGVTILAFSLEP